MNVSRFSTPQPKFSANNKILANTAAGLSTILGGMIVNAPRIIEHSSHQVAAGYQGTWALLLGITSILISKIK